MNGRGHALPRQTEAVPRLEIQTLIHAPVGACFDAARDIGLHCRLAANTGERAVAGRIKGLIGEGEWVTFSAAHFGVRLQLTAQVTHFAPPFCFVDEQTRGPFAHFRHTHHFVAFGENQTRMRDTIEFTAPFGPLGKLAAPVVAWHLRGFLEGRTQALKRHLESAAP